MRFLLFALMIALLPLRGWLGDAMATEMALAPMAHRSVAIKSIAPCAHDERAGAQFDHHLHAPEALNDSPAGHAAGEMPATPDCAGQASNGSSPMTDTPCDSCTVCQACHTVALGTAAAALRPAFSTLAQPHSAAAQFASADAARGQKPPIS